MNKLTVVMYHYVRDLKKSKYPNVKGLDLYLFIEQIKYIQKNYNIISMEEVIYSIENQSKIPSKSLLLTFDDGYSDHYENVLPVLDKYKIQGSFFAPSRVITEKIVLDVNKIHYILAVVKDKTKILNDLKVLIKKYKYQYNLEDFSTYYNKLALKTRFDSKDVIFIKRLLQVELQEELRMIIVDHLFQKYFDLDEEALSDELYLSKDQLKEMNRLGHHIGNHGYNHYWWNALSKDQLLKELDLSTNFLSEIGVDMSNWTACYPYGGFNEQAIDMIKARGCKAAFTTEVDIANLEEKIRFTIPRLDTNDLPKDKDSQVNDWYIKG